MRDLCALFDVEEREAGQLQTERLIAAIQALGGDGAAYRRERARMARAIILEV